MVSLSRGSAAGEQRMRRAAPAVSRRRRTTARIGGAAPQAAAISPGSVALRADAPGDLDRLAAGADAELAQRVLDVAAHGLERQPQGGGDRGRAETVHEQIQDLPLARGQLAAAAARATLARRPPMQLLEQPPSQLARDRGLA